MSDSDADRPESNAVPPPEVLRNRPFRFQLRTVWLVVTLLCVALGLMGQIGPVASLALVFLIGLVLCHVLGNTLGTRLRDATTRQLRDEAAENQGPTPAPPPLPQTPATRLRDKTRVVGWKTILFCGSCALTAGWLGTRHLAGGVWGSLRPQEIVLVAVSLAILGGLFTLASLTFLSVTLRCLGEFSREHASVKSPDE